MNMVCLEDFEKQASLILSKKVYSYYRSGAQNELSLSCNRSAFDNLFLAPKMLNNIDHCDTSCQLLSNQLNLPVLIAPMAFQRLVNDQGELATLEAAKKNRIGMVVSTMSSTSLEEIRNHSNKTMLWFQLYMYKDNEITKELINRAVDAGYQAIVITVDAPVMGRRYDDMKQQFKLPTNLMAANLPDHLTADLYRKGVDSSIKNFTDQYFKKSITLDDIIWVKSITSLPIIIKGILHPDDALEAAKSDIDAIIISNHGGRQLDSSIPSIEALSIIAQKLRGCLPLLMDGGIRHGTDILKALALGADAVLIGRPILWGLACQGVQGVSSILNILKDELKEAMMLSGFNTINDVKANGKSIIYRKVNYESYTSLSTRHTE